MPLVPLLLLAFGLTALSAPSQPTILSLPSLDGRTIQLFPGNARVKVFVFTRTDCPISNRYAPEVERLFQRFQGTIAGFWLVYLDKSQSADEIHRHRREYGYTIEALRDPEHRLVTRSGARVTPEAAVFVGDTLVYRGRIDDRYVAFGKARPRPTRHDLEEVLEALTAGRNVEPRTTQAIGCYIADLQ